MVHDGVQKGILWSEEALHHRHLVSYWWKRCTLLFDFHSFRWEPGGESDHHWPPDYSTMFWCSYSSCQPPPPPPPKKPTTISCSFLWSINVGCQWGRSCSQCSVPQPQLHIPLSHLCSRITADPLHVFSPIPLTVFPATSRSPASLPPLPPFKRVHHPSFFVHLSSLSLSLLIPLSLSQHTSSFTLFLLLEMSIVHSNHYHVLTRYLLKTEHTVRRK